jgi:hypothetical protein
MKYFKRKREIKEKINQDVTVLEPMEFPQNIPDIWEKIEGKLL